ncbi:MAG: 3-deoxy-8-phosphooctulonate synthase [Acidobacteria bacterium]|jgi:2-dehydro-3-deoxyphosphooctonate aldolase (KDO 8-P synthase)|nr:3-deoxy-8-phosphooctulonate synthase [Acidobacteriota bacterium]
MTAPGFDLAPEVPVGAGRRPVYVAGPCVIESTEMLLETAQQLLEISSAMQLPLVFKASFDKANRSSLASFRGPGLDDGLAALGDVKKATGLPILTDVHEAWQAERAAEVADVLQVPAFLCRQTDLLLACGRTSAAVNIKKGQFLAPEDLRHAVDKVRSTGNERVTVTERGSSFGYHNLVVDMRGLPVMRRFAPVIFDVTHSLQLPGGLGDATDGAREFHPYLARAAAAAGVDGFFVEVHPDPPRARSDATTQLTISEFRILVDQLERVSRSVREVDP